MNKQEKLNKILEMSKEIMLLQVENGSITDKEIDDVYMKTKFMLETLKELKGSEENENN